jgi:anti-sigma-K factor RskA
MNINLLSQKLLRAAKASTPSDHVPYAFEKRVLAHIQATPISDAMTLWVRALWRAALPCLAITVVLFGWAIASPGQAPSSGTANLSAALETTLMASVSFDNELSW